ncbi:MAG: hypothetical protein HY716_09000 [Planctomycetes bacterium]|nr:hypothetical protein [Planctomycetota bacterium]
MEVSTVPNQALIDASTDMVAIASATGREHDVIKTVVDGRDVTRCEVYRNLTCDEHERTSAIGLRFLSESSFAVPTIVWCDGAGHEMFRRGGGDARQIIEDLRRALEQMPGEHRSREEYEAHNRPLEEGERALVERRWKDAIDKLTTAAKGVFPSLRKVAEEKLAEIRTIGDRLLQEAQSYLEVSDGGSARERWKLLAGEFLALECGKNAAELLDTSEAGALPEKRSLRAAEPSSAGAAKKGEPDHRVPLSPSPPASRQTRSGGACGARVAASRSGVGGMWFGMLALLALAAAWRPWRT